MGRTDDKDPLGSWRIGMPVGADPIRVFTALAAMPAQGMIIAFCLNALKNRSTWQRSSQIAAIVAALRQAVPAV